MTIPDRGSSQDKGFTLEPVQKRVRAMFEGRTIADTLHAQLLLEAGRWPTTYYVPREDVWPGVLQPSEHRSRCPTRGVASYWSLVTGSRQARDAVWCYEDPPGQLSQLKQLFGFDWDAVDHWFEEDEEIFGHPRDPYHRVDVRPSTREVRVVFAGETICVSRRPMFLFETGLPARYYVPPQDVRMDLLRPSKQTSICPYKGSAVYGRYRSATARRKMPSGAIRIRFLKIQGSRACSAFIQRRLIGSTWKASQRPIRALYDAQIVARVHTQPTPTHGTGDWSSRS